VLDTNDIGLAFYAKQASSLSGNHRTTQARAKARSCSGARCDQARASLEPYPPD
jgi:hypothetical protein